MARARSARDVIQFDSRLRSQSSLLCESSLFNFNGFSSKKSGTYPVRKKMIQISELQGSCGRCVTKIFLSFKLKNTYFTLYFEFPCGRNHFFKVNFF